MSGNEIIMETKNCVVSKFTPDDFNLLYALHSDAEVMHYIGHGARSIQQVTIHLQNIINHQNTYGYSAWAVREKATNDFVGRVGLVHLGTIIATEKPFPETPVEIGYVIAKAHWQKGYASEVSNACLKWGFANIELSEIVAKTNIANYASQKILQKLGMQFKHHVMIEGRQGMYFSISRQEYYSKHEKTHLKQEAI